MCQFALFRWETSVILSNVSSVPIILETQALRSLSDLSMNFLPPSIRLKEKKKKCRLPGVNSLSSYLFQSHFPPNFPILSSIPSEGALLQISKLTRTLRLISIYPSPSPLLFAAFISPSLPGPSSNPRCQSTLSPCSTPWKAGLTGQPEVHHLPCTSQSSAFWIPRLLCWNCSPSSRMARRLDQGPFLRPVLVMGLRHWMAWTVHLCWVCFIPLPPSTSTSLGIPALSLLITFLWPDHVPMSRVPWRLCTCFFFYSASSSLASSPTLAL